MLRQWINESASKAAQEGDRQGPPSEVSLQQQPQQRGGGEEEQAVRGRLEVRCLRADGLPKMVGWCFLGLMLTRLDAY